MRMQLCILYNDYAPGNVKRDLMEYTELSKRLERKISSSQWFQMVPTIWNSPKPYFKGMFDIMAMGLFMVIPSFAVI